MDTEQAIKIYAAEKHRAKSRETTKRSYWRNPEKYRQKSIEYYRAHRTEINERRRARARESKKGGDV